MIELSKVTRQIKNKQDLPVTTADVAAKMNSLARATEFFKASGDEIKFGPCANNSYTIVIAFVALALTSLYQDPHPGTGFVSFNYRVTGRETESVFTSLDPSCCKKILALLNEFASIDDMQVSLNF